LAEFFEGFFREGGPAKMCFSVEFHFEKNEERNDWTGDSFRQQTKHFKVLIFCKKKFLVLSQIETSDFALS
jgi:hypothetical protein